MKSIQYTLRDIPPELDQILRTRAREENQSLNSILRETLLKGVGLGSHPIENREFDDLSGKWVEDKSFDATVQEMRNTIDETLWK